VKQVIEFIQPVNLNQQVQIMEPVQPVNLNREVQVIQPESMQGIISNNKGQVKIDNMRFYKAKPEGFISQGCAQQYARERSGRLGFYGPPIRRRLFAAKKQINSSMSKKASEDKMIQIVEIKKFQENTNQRTFEIAGSAQILPRSQDFSVGICAAYSFLQVAAFLKTVVLPFLKKS
jgi:hypothetical protein